MYQESTAPLLKPDQIADMKEEVNKLENALSAPPHISNQIQSPGDLRRQLNSIVRDLDSQAPKKYLPEERDAALEREQYLEEQIKAGMPTHSEMRRNPVGAVDKHRKWEARNKKHILEWKNIQRRKHASEMMDELHDAKDIANVERLRPTEASHELNMHNEQIPGRVQYGPAPGTLPTVFTNEDKAQLNEIDPEIAQGLAALNNDQRAAVKAFLQDVMVPTTVTAQTAVPKKKKKEWTDEERKAFGEKMAAARKKKQ